MTEHQPYPSSRSKRGAINNVSGRLAEESVIRHYRLAGYKHLAKRWRGAGGEIDLIFSKNETVVFVEVKASTSHAAAAERLTSRQMQRIISAASEYMGQLPQGQSTDVRFDAALVDSVGHVDVIKAAFWMS